MKTTETPKRTEQAASESSDELGDDEPCCLICGGDGIVDGSDHFDWDEEEYSKFVDCPSCGGSGKAADMTYC